MEQPFEVEAVELTTPALKLRKLDIRELEIDATDELVDDRGRSTSLMGDSTMGCACCSPPKYDS